MKILEKILSATVKMFNVWPILCEYIFYICGYKIENYELVFK